MDNVALTAAEPSPGQFPSKRGKSRSWERAIVYNPDEQTLQIRKIRKIERDPTKKYMTCSLPSQPNCVNVFLNVNDSEVTTTSGEEEGQIFIGRLNLEKLALKNQISRFFGGLRTLYIVKSPAPKSSPRRLDGGAEREISYV